ncbi:hypothetical protein [Bacillus sp. ISL-75]|uniref:hypothetical protein n=1 Tax=Bacillus sp. ISL-75 TaxID=2819137 RepID=UPI0035ABC873
MAVVDVYDALTSERSYRKSWTHGEAMKYIIENMGTHILTLTVLTRGSSSVYGIHLSINFQHRRSKTNRPYEKYLQLNNTKKQHLKKSVVFVNGSIFKPCCKVNVPVLSTYYAIDSIAPLIVYIPRVQYYRIVFLHQLFL